MYSWKLTDKAQIRPSSNLYEFILNKFMQVVHILVQKEQKKTWLTKKSTKETRTRVNKANYEYTWPFWYVALSSSGFCARRE